MSGVIDPKELGRRLQDARKARALTQEEVAEHLDCSRTTITAMEKGERSIKAEELIALAGLYGRSLNELVRTTRERLSFLAQFKAVIGADGDPENGQAVVKLQQLCEDYLELERLCELPTGRNYPAVYQMDGLAPQQAAEDLASRERSRLNLGDGPLLDLEDVFESDVGIRVFFIALPPKVAGMLAYSETSGACIAVNSGHPVERQRNSLCHEYAHFLTEDRFKPDFTVLGTYERKPRSEKFANAFARAFLMPASGLRRRFFEIYQKRKGRCTPADLCRLAHSFQVSIESLCLRLEELQLLPSGTYEQIAQAGFKVHEAKEILGPGTSASGREKLPPRYIALAIEAHERELISEGQMARFLRTNRVHARKLKQEFLNLSYVAEDGSFGYLPISSLPA